MTFVIRSATSSPYSWPLLQTTSSALSSATPTSARAVPACCAAYQQLAQHAEELRLGSGRRGVEVDPVTAPAPRPSRGRPHPARTISRRNSNNAVDGSVGQQLPSSRHDLTHPLADDRLEQRFLGREMAVDGARADAGPPGDLVDRHGQPLLGEDVVGDLQHPGTVARRIGP